MAKDQDIIQAVREQNLETLHKILAKHKPGKAKLIGHGNKKLNINFQDNDGMSALHQASLQGNTDIIQMLLESGCSVDIRDNKGMRPLHYASWQGKPNPVDLLLQWHSSTNEPANNGETPLHLACQHGHIVVVEMLLAREADPTIINNDHKTPLDLSCEFGRYQVSELLISSNLCTRILHESCTDMMDNSRTTCLHLAAKNGHVDLIRLLLQAGVDINRTTLQGTALHEAALCGKIEVVRLLLDCGIDVNKSNSYDQTALDIVNKFTTSRAAKELKTLLKDASTAVTARALQDFGNPYEPNTFYFQQGEFIKVFEQCADGQWRGTVMHDSYQPSRSGYFPASAVVVVEKDLSTVQRARSNPQFPMPGTFYANPQAHHSPVRTPGTPEHMLEPFRYSSEDQRSARDSPGNSSRNSAGSLDSGRSLGSSTQYDNRSGHSGHFNVNVHVHSQNRLSGQSYESGVGLRQSFHSTSSSSLGSLDRLEESGYSSTVNVAELVQSGMNDADIIQHWLRELGFGDYYQNFAKAGYDMPTISRMTPEDLTAIGITKPRDRKRLKSEIAKLNIDDGIPEYKPKDVYDWLRLLNLDQYYDTLSRQGYGNIEYLTDITWEDLEEIGITKLGHQKKIMLAVKALKHANSSSKRLSQASSNSSASDRRGSSELLDAPTPPMPRWSADLTHTVAADPQYTTNMGYATLKPKKNKSELSAHDIYPSRNLSSDIVHMQHQSIPVVKYQPDVIAINVNKNKVTSGEPNQASYGSFQGPIDGDITPTNERGSTPDDTDNIHLRRPALAVSPRVVAKPKPVAKIIAKTKRSSREFSSDIISVDKSGISQYATLRKPSSTPSMMYKNEMDELDAPLSPHKPRQGSPVIKGSIIPTSMNSSAPQLCSSPRSKKPPPPPKRTNSIKEREMVQHHLPQFSVPMSSPEHKPPNPILSPHSRLAHLPSTVDQEQTNNEIKSLSARFNKDREKRPSPPKPHAYVPQENEEFPPPPPPIATDLNAIKAHSQRTQASLNLNKVIEKLEEEQRKQNAELQKPAATLALSSPHKNETPMESREKKMQPPPPPVVLPKTHVAESDKPPTRNEHEYEEHPPRVVTVKRNDSVNSLSSTSSVDSNTLPFANENVGTIKQRNGNHKQSVVSVNFEDECGTNQEFEDEEEDDFEETATMKRNPNRSQANKSAATPPKPPLNNNSKQSDALGYSTVVQAGNVDNSGDILDDIGNMLQGLTDELDAMLDCDLIMD